jgi:hypothetical protein
LTGLKALFAELPLRDEGALLATLFFEAAATLFRALPIAPLRCLDGA